MITLQTMLFAMSSTKFDRDLLVHFVAHYISIGIEPHNMYFVMHSEGGVKEDIAAAMHIIREHPINYYISTERFTPHLKFNVLVCFLFFSAPLFLQTVIETTLTSVFAILVRKCDDKEDDHDTSRETDPEVAFTQTKRPTILTCVLLRKQ